MKEEFKKIWQIAMPYQDKRDDEGHARIVTQYAIKLCQIEDVNDKIVIPAAILHDIGWSQLMKVERFAIFDSKSTLDTKAKVRIKHQKEGVKLAKKILNQVSYSQDFIKPILEIISQHDTRKNFFSNDDGAVRDADKLWRYSKIGFKADLRRRGNPFDYYDKLKKRIDEKNFFFFETAKNMARKELKNRKAEFISDKID